MSNQVLKKIVRKIDLEFMSPVCVSNGEDEFTDADVMVDYEGNPFIPGSSLAGAMRDYLQLKDGIGSKDGNMSSFYISDLIFDGEVSRSVRDGIRLDENKQTIEGAKYDMEVIDAGAKGTFYMELIIRERNQASDDLKNWNTVLSGFHNQDIRLGMKKTRGYGECELLSVCEKVYTAQNIHEYVDAYKKESYQNLKDIKELIWDHPSKRFTNIELPLELKGGISIRTYSAKKGEPDFSQITGKNKKAVIPGTSISGALRSRMTQFLKEDMQVDKEKAEQLIHDLFGLEGSKEAQGHKSLIRFSENTIEGAKAIQMTRAAISRFEFTCFDGALYTEKTYVQGKVHLKIQIEDCKDWMIGLLLIALHDLQHGYLAIGGQTAIGRGIFEGNEIQINGKILNDERKYYDALVEVAHD